MAACSWNPSSRRSTRHRGLCAAPSTAGYWRVHEVGGRAGHGLGRQHRGDKGGAWRAHGGHEGRAGCLAFSRDGLTLATTGALDRLVNLWDVSFLRALEFPRKSKKEQLTPPT
jgi:WD40 repeat protein